MRIPFVHNGVTHKTAWVSNRVIVATRISALPCKCTCAFLLRCEYCNKAIQKSLRPPSNVTLGSRSEEQRRIAPF